MARYERIINHVATTLNGAIDDTVTSITVTSASGWPLLGDFRLLIDNEVVLVTSHAANVLTVTRGVDGTSAASHSSGVSVDPIMTQTGLDTYFDHVVGYTSRMPPARLLDSTGAVITSADFSFDNQASSYLEDNVDGSMTLVSQEADTSGATLNVVYKSAPSPPWIITVGFQVGPGCKWGTNATTMGLLVRDSGDGDFINIACNLNNGWGVNHWNSPTSFAATLAGSTAAEADNAWFWMQIEDDNTDLFWRGSHDGITFFELATETRGTRLTNAGPDQIGFQISERAEGSAIPRGPHHEVTVKSWREE